MPQFTLLTGATGLVGSILMRDMLSRQDRLAILVRRGTHGHARVLRFLEWCEGVDGRPLTRPIVLEGDINAPHLGLGSPERRWIASDCHRVVHSAAALKFVNARRDRDPWKTNVQGTENLLELCRDLGLRNFHYVSTAYVCGRRQGVIRESELDAGQEFRNDYERSKYAAETMVRQCDWIDPPTVYRPVIVTGDSRTGYSPSFHGIYFYMKLLDSLLGKIPADSSGRKHAPLRIALNGDEPLNVVPVDWVSQVICMLLDEPQAQGQTFHLAPRVRLTTRQFLEDVYQIFDCSGALFTGSLATARVDGLHSARSRLEQAFLRQTRLYHAYEKTDPVFDEMNVRKFADHLPCPTIDRAVLDRYVRFGQATDWGKRALPDPTRGNVRKAA